MERKIQLSLNKDQKYVIFSITLGNILEWYDFYLYIFWSKTLSYLFFGNENTPVHLFFIIAFFSIGFIFRPLGGLFFGRLGDRVGRKKAFILSLLMMSVSTFAMGFIPTYAQAGIFAPIILAFLRIAQTFPSGGELPGAFCYLYESGPRNKKFTTSFAGVGNQIGIILAAIECGLLEKLLPDVLLNEIGWRISFIIGGLIGLAGIFLRSRLHETNSFQEMVTHHRIVKTSILNIFKNNGKKILRGASFGTMQTICFHFISILFPIYFFRLTGMSESEGLIATIILLLITTIPLPFYGLIAEKYKTNRMVILSCTIVILLLYPLYKSIEYFHPWYAMIIIGLIALCVACLTATWPYFLSHLFPTSIRYTCVGLSFNITDGVLGGVSSLFAFYLINVKNNLELFSWVVFTSCVISIISCLKIKPIKEK